jgi:murein DD-endopeptidase MepM/ murein hydrolase activator NlpD
LQTSRGPAVHSRGGKGSYVYMPNPDRVPTRSVLARVLLAHSRLSRVALLAAMLAGALVAAALLAATALAQNGTGGASPSPAPSPEATPAPDAPVATPVRSKIRLARLVCVKGCASSGPAQAGALLRIRGRGMRRASEVDFGGAAGDADDVAAAPVRRRKRSLDVRVPLGAVSGQVTVMDRDGVSSRPAPALLAVETAPPARGASGGPSIEADVQAPRAFFDAARPMRVSYVVHDDQAVNIRVELVRVSDGAVIASWTPGLVQPETPQVVTWDGTAGGHVQKTGRYTFRVTAADQGGAVVATSAQNTSAPATPAGPDPAAFRFLRHQFPVRGPHGYGEFAAHFGGGRGHQGQDVFAACGTPLVAARGGIVKFKQYQSRAGYYLVIDGQRTSVDYAYMHLREPALVDQGERVRTGQLIGYVGDTGDASACHLHFEMWTGPGWYSGGAPFDPLPDLLAWDKAS